MTLLVLGASGGCGRWLCRLAPARGHSVRALVRPSTSVALAGADEVLRGEVLDPDVLDHALSGCDAVVSALGIRRRAPWNPWSALASPPDLTTRVARHLVEAMPRHGVGRVVAISAGGVGDSADRVSPLFRWLIDHSSLAPAYHDLAGMEAAFAASPLDWQAVRPVTLTGGPPTGTAARVKHYGLVSTIRRADVATWMLDALDLPGPFARRTPMIAA